MLAVSGVTDFPHFSSITTNPSPVQALIWGVDGIPRSTSRLMKQEGNESNRCRRWLKIPTPTFPYGTRFLPIMATLYGLEIRVVMIYHMITLKDMDIAPGTTPVGFYATKVKHRDRDPWGSGTYRVILGIIPAVVE